MIGRIDYWGFIPAHIHGNDVTIIMHTKQHTFKHNSICNALHFIPSTVKDLYF